MVSIKPNHPLDRATGLWRSLLCLFFLVNMEICSSFFFFGQQGDFFLDVAFALGFAGAGASGFSFFDPMG